MSWDDAAAPFRNYTIQVSTSASFGTLLVNSTTLNSFYAMTKNLPAGKVLYWRLGHRPSPNIVMGRASPQNDLWTISGSGASGI